MPTDILSDASIPPHKLLSRQEIVALFNLLNQFAKSVQFASHATEKELNYKINEALQLGKTTGSYGLLIALLCYLVIKGLFRIKRSRLSGKKTD